MYGMVKQCGSTFHRVHYIEPVFILLVIDIEFFYNINSFFLNYNLVEHHSATPHATAGGKFTVKLCYFQSGLCQIVSSYDTRRTTTYNGDVQIKVSF